MSTVVCVDGGFSLVVVAVGPVLLRLDEATAANGWALDALVLLLERKNGC